MCSLFTIVPAVSCYENETPHLVELCFHQKWQVVEYSDQNLSSFNLDSLLHNQVQEP